MRVKVGTSGYSYKEWKGAFYPEKLAASGFLRFYAERFGTVEINNTFYRMPSSKLVQGWASEVPDDFQFAIKAPQRITHIAKLVNASESLAIFDGVVRELGARLGPVLFQLPPYLRKDLSRLTAFLEDVPESLRCAFEFRHPSWFDDDVWTALRGRGAALCVAEGESLESPLVATASWGYVRLRRDDYPDAVLDTWAERIRAQAWQEVFVYLKHDAGRAPAFAHRLIERLGDAAT